MKSFTKLAFVTALMTATMSIAAQSNVGILTVPGTNVTATINGNKDSKFVTNKQGNTLTQVRKQNPNLRTNEQYVTINFNPICSENVTVNVIRVIPTTENPQERWDTGENTLNNLPVGSYDILVSLYDSEALEGILIMKENVTITCDTTIDIDVNEAQPVIFTTYRPDGEIFKVNKYGYDDEGNEIVIEKGNIDHSYGLTFIYRKSDFADIYTNLALDGDRFRMNHISERFVCTENLVYANEGKDACFYINKFYINGDEKILKNNPEDYYYIDEKITSSKKGETSEKMIGCGYDVTYNGNLVLSAYVDGINGEIVKMWVNAPLEPVNKRDRVDLLVRPTMCDNKEIDIYEIKDFEGNVIFTIETPIWQRIYGPTIVAENGNKDYIINGPVAEINNFITSSDGNKRIYPGNSVFSFAESQKYGDLGNNTPINLIYSGGWAYEGVFTPELYYCYLGRYGESREVDKYNSDLIMKVNGKTITSFESKDIDFKNINSFFSPWENPDRELGLVELTFDNQNIIVDGLQGRNLTYVKFDESKEDHIAPTLTMLQMRDGNGNVTDRFETAQDGKVTFSCGDFNYHLFADEFSGWVDCEISNVETSVAPYGQNEWQKLNITEDIDAYAPIAFGHIFSADISALKNDGWYDLKFKLTDAAGNMQEQIVSPAFRIGDTQTGIGDVKSSNATEVCRYTIDGRVISAPQPGINIIKMSDGSSRKEFVR